MATEAPTTNASVLCRASYPDNGKAFQKYNPHTNKWMWVYVGAGVYGKSPFTKAAVLRQLKPSRYCGGGERYAPGWYRYVLVRWTRRKGGWRATILKASPAVQWPQKSAKKRKKAIR